MRRLFQRHELFLDGLAAIDRDDPHLRQKRRELAELLGNLDAEFPGGADHHRLGIHLVHPQIFEQRNAEGTGLAGAGGRLGNDVVPVQHRRDGSGLYRRGGGKAHPPDGF